MPDAAMGYLVRCTECGHEERTGSNPLRDGWPREASSAAFVAGWSR